MPDRLTPLDVSFLYLEEPTTPMHVGSVAVFQPPEGFDYAELLELIGRRIALVPRYRQKVRQVPGRLANPVWVDDRDFDITYHVRRSGLPRPGSTAQLLDLVARVQSRQLDRRRPLWELYLVEGLTGGRVAMISKTHSAVVDGSGAVDLGTVLLDPTPVPRATPAADWAPRREPGTVGLVASAVFEAWRRPTAVVDTARTNLGDLRTSASRLLGTAAGLLDTARTAARPAPDTPLNVDIGEQRRFATACADLDDYRRVRKAHGGTVNDVVLATVAGALREWLLARGEPVRRSTTMRALVPVSVQVAGQDAGARVRGHLVDLPLGEPSPVVRLQQVTYAMRGHKESRQSVGADVLVRLGGFAAPTLHQLGARAAGTLSRRLFNLVVTNVPGPQLPLYAGGARMLEVFPVVPLAKGHAVSIGVTSYDGRVFYGMNADRDVLPDLAVLSAGVTSALAELLGTTR